MEELIKRIKDTFETKEEKVEVIRSEPEVMYTLKAGRRHFKAIKFNNEWVINELK